MRQVKSGKAVHAPARRLIVGVLRASIGTEKSGQGRGQQKNSNWLCPGHKKHNGGSWQLRGSLRLLRCAASQVAVHARRTRQRLRWRARKSPEEKMRSRAGAGMWIMAGGALHPAAEQRNVAVAVNGVEVRRGLDTNGRRRGGIGIHEVDRMLLGQIAYGGVTGHEERALRQGLEVRARLRLIPGVDGHSTVMAAQAQVADCELAADVRGCG